MNLLPPSIAELSDDDLIDLYTAGASAPWLRVNFVATLDGSASAAGVSGSLGGPDDLRVFDLLRRVADVVLVAAGTVRDEGYGPMVLHDADVAWRRAHGLPDHPVFAIVSRSLSLDAGSRVFTEAPVRPVVLTSAAASDVGVALSSVADVVPCSTDTDPDSVDVSLVRDALVARGLGTIHCEGGPSFLGSLIAADAVDELTLTIDPSLEGGAGPRIARGSSPELRRMRPAHVLRGAGDVLLTRYVRAEPSARVSVPVDRVG
ncbi:riboflavin biosynthesis pyrimidine reductase [Curtobacterium sp. PhB42]|uniref:pyrimidine reductase family protein n=1 Tax=unclassified Curtobacterium TaxID=257496 RepID=UPI0010641055|nr:MULTISPECIES: pyrimidine reductase family protein [unclassified Curtobacterium]TDW49493.1 riboflavin biosynthesis pyrimidine reductase [Curtobacterium sp. PhB42]TDW56470.1 riboflavin biosynthesis pyrimidine reductase [Curtobacterium sp. PhB190]